MNRQEHREKALFLLRYYDIAAAQVHALLALSADPEPTLTGAGFPALPDLPAVLHEVHATMTSDRMEYARRWVGKIDDSDLLRVRDSWFLQAAWSLPRVVALDERLAAISDD